LGAVAHPQLAQDVGDVVLDRAFGDVEGSGDLAVGLALGDETQDVQFTVGEGLDQGLGRSLSR